MAGRISRPQRGAAPAIRYLHHILGSHSYRSWSGPRSLRSKQWWLFLGLELTADNPTTRACRDVEPCIRLPIALGGAAHDEFAVWHRWRAAASTCDDATS